MWTLLLLTAFTAASQIKPPLESGPSLHWTSPDRFQQLPARFVKQLKDHGCRIPQPNAPAGRPYARLRSSNVIHGHFGSAKQTDWAVVCTVEDKSTIFIYWGGRSQCTSEINVEMESRFSSDPVHGYSREITTATNKSIHNLFEDEKLLPPVPIRHDGIWDIYDQKEGSLDYCYEGKWLHHINGGH